MADDVTRTEWLELAWRDEEGMLYRVLCVAYRPVEAEAGPAHRYRVECDGVVLGHVAGSHPWFGRVLWAAQAPDAPDADYLHARRRDAVGALLGARMVRHVCAVDARYYRERARWSADRPTPLDRILATA